MATELLERKNYNYALKLKLERHFPAAVIGAEFSYYKVVDRSSREFSIKLVSTLRDKLLKVGALNSKINGNLLGRCAEVAAANQILEKAPFTKISNIVFSKALRPRTMQEVPRCKNCKLTFK